VLGRRTPGRKAALGAIALPVVALVALLIPAAPASAAFPTPINTLAADANCADHTTGPLDYVFCDDGLPPSGGTTPNPGGVNAVTVPAKYGGDGHTGLPSKDLAGSLTMPGADPSGNIALDVDLTLPRSAPPASGYPIVFMMHGCCAGDKKSWEADEFDADGEKWHYSNAWFASRGYVVVNYTARGFKNGEQNGNRGSTGETQLDSRSFEINDFQSLACQVLDNAGDWDTATGNSVAIDPNGVVVTGGSYGGGFSWLALTDPRWTCNADTGSAGTDMSLVAAAPKYGWTDLVYSLDPTGTHLQEPGNMPATNGCDSGPTELDGSPCPNPQTPLGMPKASINGALYASGKTGIPPGSSHTTFPPSIDQAFLCVNGPYPAVDPACQSSFPSTLQEFLNERSAYYQNQYFSNLAADPGTWEVPAFNAATLTDPLFTPVENRRMLNRLRAVDPDYPIQVYHGDYQHFVQNKAKEWGDMCGNDDHVCADADYPGGANDPGDFNANPGGLKRTGVTTRLNRFIDHFADPGANQSEPTPDFDVTASLQVCPRNAGGLGVAADEPGPTFTAPTFEQLAPNALNVEMPGTATTTSTVPANTHAAGADPVGNFVANGGECPEETTLAGPGVATYTSDELPATKTMIGATRAEISYSEVGPDPVAAGFQLNARLYDLFPDGTAVMVDRGVRRIDQPSGTVVYELHGNGWRFPQGHQIRIEVAQDDNPFVKNGTPPSSATLSSVNLRVPIREGGATIGGGPTLLPGHCENLRIGSGAKDELRGTDESDDIRGGDGNDLLKGLKGDDCLAGENGKDKVRGGKGKDELNGNKGKDKLGGGKGRDKLKGGKGRDKLRGGKGKDVIKAKGGGRDVIRCKGRDRVKADHKDRLKHCHK
jgi:X-Pro dipeptidyl-peptidase C-terminal non-catalytic domain/RTX calcium-binding nonapeptide repeat (4 copies)